MSILWTHRKAGPGTAPMRSSKHPAPIFKIPMVQIPMEVPSRKTSAADSENKVEVAMEEEAYCDSDLCLLERREHATINETMHFAWISRRLAFAQRRRCQMSTTP